MICFGLPHYKSTSQWRLHPRIRGYPHLVYEFFRSSVLNFIIFHHFKPSNHNFFAGLGLAISMIPTLDWKMRMSDQRSAAVVSLESVW